jgi:HAE1 family hydrophobic/amphiphilic exporter-1
LGRGVRRLPCFCTPWRIPAVVNFFITRPIFAGVVAIIMVLAGAVGYLFLPVAQFPPIAPPQVVVSAAYPGASAQIVADTVTTPLEQQLNGVEGMAYMSSVSANDGTSKITITFNVGYNVDIAAVDVQNRVSQATGDLPAIVNQGGITIQKEQPNFTLLVNMVSPDGSVDALGLSNYAYLQLVDPLKRLKGASDVSIFGEKRYSMRIWLKPDRLAALGVTAAQVQAAITEQNQQVAGGKLGEAPSPANQKFELQINTPGRLTNVGAFENIIVRAGNGSSAMIRLKDIARVELGAQSYDSNAYLDGKPTIAMAIYQLPGANALALDKLVRAKMAELAVHFPPGISYEIKYDTTVYVSASVREVVITLAESMALVFRRVHLPAKLAHHADPRNFNPGLAYRHARRHGGRWLLHQHRQPAGPCAGDRAGGGRRDRCRRKHQAPDRRWQIAARCGKIRYDRSNRADYRHHGGADGGVCAGRLSARYHRPTL